MVEAPTNQTERRWLESHPAIAPALVVAGMAVLNAAGEWLPEGWVRPVAVVRVGAVAMEPFLFAAWAALGPGWWITRWPLVMASYVLVLSFPGLDRPSFADISRYEFVYMLLAGAGMFTVAVIVLLIVRGVTGLRIQHSSEQRQERPVFQFNMRYLLVLMSLSAAAIGMFSSLKFAQPKPPGFLSGPAFYLAILIYGSAICMFALAPVSVIGLYALVPTWTWRGIRRLAVAWAVATILIMMVWASLDESWDWELLGIPVVQSGGVLVALASAFLLRQSGFRLHTRANTALAPELPMPNEPT